MNMTQFSLKIAANSNHSLLWHRRRLCKRLDRKWQKSGIGSLAEKCHRSLPIASYKRAVVAVFDFSPTSFTCEAYRGLRQVQVVEHSTMDLDGPGSFRAFPFFLIFLAKQLLKGISSNLGQVNWS